MTSTLFYCQMRPTAIHGLPAQVLARLNAPLVATLKTGAAVAPNQALAPALQNRTGKIGPVVALIQAKRLSPSQSQPSPARFNDETPLPCSASRHHHRNIHLVHRGTFYLSPAVMVSTMQ